RGSEHRRDAERRLSELRRMSDVPSEKDLDASRAERDRLWEEIKESPAREPIRPAGMFEIAMRRADGIADRLRHDADRVAQRAGLEAEIAAAVEEEARLEASGRALARAEQALLDAWETEWVSVGISPKRPAEMRAWVRDFQALVELDQDIA